MAAPATRPKSAGRRLYIEPERKGRPERKDAFIQTVLREGRTQGWKPSLRQAVGTGRHRSASTTASDASEPKRQRNLSPETDLAAEAGSATRGPLKKQTSGPTVRDNRRQSQTRCKSESSESNASETTGLTPLPGRRCNAPSKGARRPVVTTEKDSRTTRSTLYQSEDEYE
jgi:hypothetical protein